jgi:ABC-type nitrate/sulfonate/bicarbonate transport system substrate-binding protein
MNNNKIIIALAITVSIAIGAGLVFATKKSEPKKLVTIRVLESTAPNQWEIAKNLTGRDILEEEGVKLERISGVQSTGGTQTLQALLANNIDYGGSHWPAWINIIAAGGKIKAVVTGGVTTKETVSNGFVVLENSDIHSAKDLVGKRIAVNVLGAENDYVVRQYLKQNGLSIDQVQLIVVPWAQQELMLKSGQVDVSASFSYGYFGLASERGGLRELPGTRNYDIKGNNVASGSGFREDFIKKNPDAVRNFITAHEKAQRLVYEEFKKDPERVRKAYVDIATEKGGNPKLAAYYRPSSSPEYQFATDKDIQYWFDVIEAEGKLKPGQLKPSDIYTHEYNSFFKK